MAGHDRRRSRLRHLKHTRNPVGQGTWPPGNGFGELSVEAAPATIPTLPCNRMQRTWRPWPRRCVKCSKRRGVDGGEIRAIALDTTGSSVVMVDCAMQPLDDYYLWCDHRARNEAQEITVAAHAQSLEAIQWCGGVYSHEWGWAKLLHWLRNHPESRQHFASAFETLRHGRSHPLRHHRTAPGKAKRLRHGP